MQDGKHSLLFIITCYLIDIHKKVVLGWMPIKIRDKQFRFENNLAIAEC